MPLLPLLKKMDFRYFLNWKLYGHTCRGFDRNLKASFIKHSFFSELFCWRASRLIRLCVWWNSCLSSAVSSLGLLHRCRHSRRSQFSELFAQVAHGGRRVWPAVAGAFLHFWWRWACFLFSEERVDNFCQRLKSEVGRLGRQSWASMFNHCR